MSNGKEKKEIIVKENAVVSADYDMVNDGIESVVDCFTEGTDYGLIPGCKHPSMYKPGAEKVCLRFGLRAEWSVDREVLEMLKDVKGLVAFKCTLIDRKSGTIVGEGRGSAVLGAKENSKYPNSAVKMAKKSGLIDAALTTFALSGRFTQDVEDLNEGKNPEEKTKISINGETGQVTQEVL